MDAVGTIQPPTHPPHQLEIRSLSFFIQCFAMSPLKLFPLSTKYVWCTHLPFYFVCAVSPTNTWPRLNYRSSSICISECGSSNWTCISFIIDPISTSLKIIINNNSNYNNNHKNNNTFNNKNNNNNKSQLLMTRIRPSEVSGSTTTTNLNQWKQQL